MAQKFPSPRSIRRAHARAEEKAARKAGNSNPGNSNPGNSNPGNSNPGNSNPGNSNPSTSTAAGTATATEAQVQANRENARHSTGPVSREGKAAVSQNRRTHGLNCKAETFTVLACESQADFDNLFQTFLDEQNPQDTLEHLLVASMAQHRWLFQRANRLQESCFDSETGQIADQKLFSLYLRYATTHERAFHKCLADLLKLRKDKVNQEIGFESEKRAAETHEHAVKRWELELVHRSWEVSALQVKVFRLERLNPDVPNVAKTL